MTATPLATTSTAVPLYVDLDGSLTPSDLLIESTLRLLKQRPMALLDIPGWLARGKSVLKARIASETDVDVTLLPYREEVIALARDARAQGRRVVLATASNEKFAQAVAAHLGLFDAVLASNDARNLSGTRKLAAIQADAGGPFSYVGNDDVDLPIWAASTSAVVVSASGSLASRARAVCSVVDVVPTPKVGLKTVARAMRLHQWAKNLLLLLPAIPIAADLTLGALGQLLLAIVCFGLCASSVYLLNDLLDLDADRQHRSKRLRPIPCGLMPLGVAMALVPVLLFGAFVLSLIWLPLPFSAVLALYWVLTVAYSFRLKRAVVVDVILLAGLYTMRVLAGGTVIGVKPSFWILAFSIFLFFSLASAKRYIELDDAQRSQKKTLAGRGYTASDLPLILAQGICAGQMSTLVFALYINDPTSGMHFRSHYPLWAIGAILLYWISRLWMKVIRNEIHHDPVLFALRDRQSQVMVLVVGVMVLMAL